MTTRRSGRRGRGFFGIAVYQPKTAVNIGTLWRSAWLYDAAFIATIGRRYHKQPSDTPGTANHVPLYNYPNMPDMLAHLPHSCPIVGIELHETAKDLSEFAHPPRAVYLLGAEDRGLPQAVIDQCHYLVQIPTVRPWSMNVAVAGSIVMYDRLIKGNGEKA